MKEALSIETERMDDIPLLITHMQRMKLTELLDKHIPTHGHRKGLSVGELSMVWLAHILSQADHRMNRVQEWATRRLETLRGCGMDALCPQDLTDDRLADVLRLFSDDVHWHAFEQELMGQLVRVYDLPAICVRIDTTTASSYADVNEQGLLQLGHSKDRRPDLPQLKLVLASLDPLGMPLATEVLSGEHADDPVYLPIIARMRDGLQQKGLLYVGDCKMAALQTRASIQAQGDSYLCPLSAIQAPPAQVGQEVETLRERPVRAYRGRLSGVRRDLTFTVSSEREEQAIEKVMSQLGWRVYATNVLPEHLTLDQAVEAYRDEYLVERNFSRLKGRPLSLAPLYVQRDDHRVGLVRLLTLALRVITLLEGVVRQRLSEQKTELAGLFAGNPKRRTSQPPTERLLEAFREVTLTVVHAQGYALRHVTPLSPLQEQILSLLGFSSAVYLQ
jgi:transposase